MLQLSHPFDQLFIFKFKPRFKAYVFEQIRDQFIAHIENGIIDENTQLPSINYFSEKYGLSKVTVGRAYQHLKYKGYISFVPGKGYFVVRSKIKLLKILIIYSELDDEVLMFHRGMLDGLSYQARFDLQSYHADTDNLYELIEKSKNIYDHLLLMPRYQECEWLSESIRCIIPANKSASSGKTTIELHMPFSNLLKISEADFHIALERAEYQIRFYNEIIIIANIENYQSLSIISAVKLFCSKRPMSYHVLTDITAVSVKKGQLYIVCEDEDLVKLIHGTNISGIETGSDIGIISINEKPWKELLGISVFNLDLATLGKRMALGLCGREHALSSDRFRVIRRKSF